MRGAIAELAGDRQRAPLAREQMARQREAPPRDLVDPAQHRVDLAGSAPRKRPRSTVENRSRLSTHAAPPATIDLVAATLIGVHSAAAAWPSPAIQRSRSASARGVSARFLPASSRCRAAARPLRLLIACGERRKQAEIDVHRLVGARSRPAVECVFHVAAGDVGEQRAVRRGRRRRQRAAPPSRSAAAKRPASSPMAAEFHVAFAAGDLAGKAQARLGAQPQRAVEQLGRVEEGVAVKPAEPRELGLLQTGNGAEDPSLLAVLELGLEAYHVEQRAEPVVLTQLDDGIGLDTAAHADWSARTASSGRGASVSRPRSAITSIGRQPSK